MAKKLAAKDYMKNFVPPTKRTSVIRPSPAKTSQKAPEILKEVQNKVNDVGDKKIAEHNTSEKETAEKSNERTINSNFDSQTFVGQSIADSQSIVDSQAFAGSQAFADSQTIVDSQPIENTKFTDTADSQLNDDLTIENFSQDDFFADDMDVSQIEEDESQPRNNIEENLADVLQSEFMNEWENLTNQVSEMDVDKLLTNADIPLIDVDGKKVNTFRFFFHHI